MPARPDPVLITTDLDRTLIFSQRATAELGGALPADPVETAGERTAGELCRAARDALAAMPAHVRICVATSRNMSRLRRLRLPFAVPYAIAVNGGVLLVDGEPDPEWSARIAGLIARAAPAAEVRAVLVGTASCDAEAPRTGRRAAGVGSAAPRGPAWLVRSGDQDDMCCLAIVDPMLLVPEEFAAIASRCVELGWEASLVGRKLYAFPVGFGKEHAAAFLAGKVAGDEGAEPLRLAAGDTEHDRLMLTEADLAWVPAGSELAAACGDGEFVVTEQPGHAAAAQITRDWLNACVAGSDSLPQVTQRPDPHARGARQSTL